MPLEYCVSYPMPLLLKFHGALKTVTGSCHFFKVKKSGNIYAVDCGATQGSDDEDQLALPSNLPIDCRPDKLSGIILTHAHGDHISHLPRWFKAGFKGRIFCSRETAKLAEIALIDGKKIEKKNDRWDIEEKVFEETLDGLKSSKHVQPGETQILEHDVTIEGALTSHLLGCCAYRINAQDGDKATSVLYTGDIGPIEHDSETQSLYSERQRHESASDYIISESTYGDRPRSKDSQSGRRRLAKMCEVLSKGFRHGDDSLVIIPAFSLQRSLDVLIDVFCALQYQRAQVGISKSCIPLIIIKSPLSWDCAQVYRDFFFDEKDKGHVFFNRNSLFQKLVREAGDDELDVMDSLVPLNDRKSGFDGNDVVSRLDEADEKIQTEISWGRGASMEGRPTVIICGSGMTLHGPIVDLLDEYLKKEFATFALCGFVPPKSPGFQLRQLWPLSLEERSAHAIQLHKDKKNGPPAKIIPGDEVKCGLESVSDFYSGHADGASIIRYILGEKLERASQTKGIFLVHGERTSREGLKELLNKTCASAGIPIPMVHCPEPNMAWFDCETGQFEKGPSSLSISPQDEMLTMGSDRLPDVIALETCVVITNTGDEDEILDQIVGAFDFARPETRDDGVLLKLGRPGKAYSTILLKTGRIGDSLIKVSVATRIKQSNHLSELTDIAFDWKRLLNLLGVSKELYFAGVRWCQTDAEIDRLLVICQPCVYGRKQRRQPVLILHADTLTGDEVLSIERLLTPAVVVAIVQEHSVRRINQALGLEGDHSLSRANPVYLPIKFNAGTPPVRSETLGIDIDRLSEAVSIDTFILAAREPQIVGSGQPSPLTLPLTDTAPDELQKLPLPVKAKPKRPAAKELPYELFARVAVGQAFKGTVEHLRRRADGTPSFAIVRLPSRDVNGMLHHTQMIPRFDCAEGEEVDVLVRQVDPDQRKVFFTQQPIRLPTTELLNGIGSWKIVSAADISLLLGDKVPADSIANAAALSMQQQGKEYTTINIETRLSPSTLIDTYNRVVHDFNLVDTPFIPSPEPVKGLTYGEVATELGYELADIINAAGHMIGDAETYQLGVAVLPAGFTPTETSAFPAELKESFIRECRERADKNWSKQLDLEAALKPDCLSLSGLAKAMGISDSELLTLMTEKGIQPKVQVVLTPDDIKKLGP